MGRIFDLAGEPRPRLRWEVWGLHAGRLGTFSGVRKTLSHPPSWGQFLNPYSPFLSGQFLHKKNGASPKKKTLYSTFSPRVAQSHLLTEGAGIKYSYYSPCIPFLSPPLKIRRSEPESPQRKKNKKPYNNPCATPPRTDLQNVYLCCWCLSLSPRPRFGSLSS